MNFVSPDAATFSDALIRAGGGHTGTIIAILGTKYGLMVNLRLRQL
jgi:hypothetical protein